jgi:putative ABC transport system permease protein
MAGLAGLALALAGIGIYSVNAYVVSQRGSEIALRLALGASSRDILSNILTRGLILALAGILAGIAGAFVVGKLLTSALVGIGAQDPLTLLEAAALLVVISVVACYFPARRAIRIDPGSALRQD